MTDGLELEIDASEINELLEQFPKFENVIFGEMDSAMHGSLSIFEEQVVGRTPVGVSGDLRKSITPIVRGKPPNFVGRLATPLVYGEPVERGRAPGSMPPVDAIELWVRRKLGISGDESRQVAWAIALTIKQRWTEGVHMFRDGFEAGKATAEKLWKGVPDRAVNKIERLI